MSTCDSTNWLQLWVSPVSATLSSATIDGRTELLDIPFNPAPIRIACSKGTLSCWCSLDKKSVNDIVVKVLNTTGRFIEPPIMVGHVVHRTHLRCRWAITTSIGTSHDCWSIGFIKNWEKNTKRSSDSIGWSLVKFVNERVYEERG